MVIGTVTPNTSVDKLYLVDALHPYNVSRVKEVHNTAGGKGLNVARIVAQAGEQAIAAGFVGGYNGAYFESLIQDSSIQKHFTKIQQETRCCINLWDREKNQSTEYLEPGFVVSEEDIQKFLTDYRQIVEKSDVVCISGSFPENVPEDLAAQMVGIAQQKKKPVLIDTTGLQLKHAYGALPTVIKPNKDEILQLMDIDVGRREKLVEAVKNMHKDGIALATISLGSDGVLASCEEGTFHLRPPSVKVVNTVGSGDSMIGGLAVGIARGYSWKETLRFACAIATANTLTMSTGSYKQKDFDWLLNKIQIDEF